MRAPALDANPIRLLPPQQERVESGPIRFGDDRPGIFLRGEHACYLASNLANLARIVAKDTDDSTTLLFCMMVANAATNLAMSDVHGLILASVDEAGACVREILSKRLVSERGKNHG